MKKTLIFLCLILSYNLFSQNNKTILPGLDKITSSTNESGFLQVKNGKSFYPFIDNANNIPYLSATFPFRISANNSSPNLKLDFIGTSISDFKTITTHNNYTQLGYDSPAVKVKVINGFISDEGYGDRAFYHYLDADKILDVKYFIDCGNNGQVSNVYNYNPGYYCSVTFNSTLISTFTNGINSVNIRGKPIKIYITYEQ